MMDRAGVGAILLAAGQSRRMGAANKLLLGIDGEPMVRRAARALLDSRAEEVVAVLGHQSAAVGEALAGLPVRIVLNAAFREGQMTSVRCGLEALSDYHAGILVALADQPSLTAADLNFLIDAFLSGDREKILVPVRGDLRGNPIVLAAHHCDEFAGRDLNFGCRNLIARNPQAVRTVEPPNDRFFKDVDTPDDYAAEMENSVNSDVFR